MRTAFSATCPTASGGSGRRLLRHRRRRPDDTLCDDYPRRGLGYGIALVLGSLVGEISAGAHYASIFGALMLSALVGGAVGPFLRAALHGRLGSFTLAFAIAVGLSGLSALSGASRRARRAVAGRTG